MKKQKTKKKNKRDECYACLLGALFLGPMHCGPRIRPFLHVVFQITFWLSFLLIFYPYLFLFFTPKVYNMLIWAQLKINKQKTNKITKLSFPPLKNALFFREKRQTPRTRF